MTTLAEPRDRSLAQDVFSLEQGLLRVEEALGGLLGSGDPLLAGPVRRLVLEAGGKRVRPRLVLLSYAACGGLVAGYDEAVDAAAAYELIHAASLVHDDVIDRAPLRRGVPAVHAEEGDGPAIVAGDYLFTLGFSRAARLPAEVIPVVTRACVRLAEGQLLEMRCTSGAEVADLEKSMEVVAKKTAALFEGCAATGAILAGAPDGVVEALASYGLDLGVAFQIQDDVLDVVGNPEAMGKLAGTDAAAGVATVPELLGGVERAREVAVRLARRARDRLVVLEPGPARDALWALADAVVDRHA